MDSLLPKIEENSRQLKAVWHKLDEVGKVSGEAITLAKHADKGFIEAFSNITQLNKDVMRIEKTVDNISEKLTSNLMWTLVYMTALLTLFGSGIGAVILYFGDKLIK